MDTTLDSSAQVLGALAAGAAFKYASLMWMNRAGKAREYVGRVSKVLIYPLKSVREIETKVADLTKHGLKYNGIADR